jgi:EAL domain-containing protein (putative c-di-GMP-specific phosphodiesterase class I)
LRIFAQRIAPTREITRTSGIECLARLVAEDGAIVEPADFLSAASRYQLSRAIDEWMIKHALEALQPHASMLFHGDTQVALNISEQSLRDDDFLRYVEDQVRRSDLAPGLIAFEIDENVAARDVARTDVALRRLRKLGCKIAIDGFGAAASSLSHMRGLRPNQVKIDGTLVHDVLTSADGEANIRAIVELAAAYDVECVAKHIESDAVLHKLRELGVHHVQGNRLHAAEPLTGLLETLRAEESRQLDRLHRQ